MGIIIDNIIEKDPVLKIMYNDALHDTYSIPVSAMLKSGNKISPDKEIEDFDFSAIDEKDKELVNKLLSVKSDYQMSILILEAKISYIAEMISESIKNDNPLQLMLGLRSFIEHVGSYEYLLNTYEEKIELIIKYGRDLDSINNTLDILDKFFKEFIFSSKDKKKYSPKTPKELRGYIKKYFKDIDDYYGTLCEFVHPNFGSNILTISTKKMNGKDIIQICGASDDKEQIVSLNDDEEYDFLPHIHSALLKFSELIEVFSDIKNSIRVHSIGNFFVKKIQEFNPEYKNNPWIDEIGFG